MVSSETNGQNKLLKELKLYAKITGSVTKENILSIYNTLSILAAKKKEIIETPVELASQLSGLFMGCLQIGRQ